MGYNQINENENENKAADPCISVALLSTLNI
jgi:hypothetical protein